MTDKEDKVVLVPKQVPYQVKDRIWAVVGVLIAFGLGTMVSLFGDRLKIENRDSSLAALASSDHEKMARFDQFEASLAQVVVVQQQVLQRLTALEQGGSVMAREGLEKATENESRINKLEAIESTQVSVREFDAWKQTVSEQLAENRQILMKLSDEIDSLLRKESGGSLKPGSVVIDRGKEPTQVMKMN